MFEYIKNIITSVKETNKELEAESQIKQANRALEYMYAQVSRVPHEKFNSTWKESMRERIEIEMDKVYPAMTYLDSLYYFDLESFLYTQKEVYKILYEEKDDVWIEKLWLWADKAKILDLGFVEGEYGVEIEKGFPRDKKILLELEILDLRLESLDYLPFEIGKLTKLTEIILSQNNLTNLPLSFSKLINLKELWLDCNKFEVFPNVLLKIRSLETLCIDCCYIQSIPDEIYKLDRLKNLTLRSEGDIFSPSSTSCRISNELSKLYNLEFLGIENFRLSQVPPMICNMINLKNLSVGSAEKMSCPYEIGNLKNLKHLSLSGSDELPDSICNLTQLTFFSLRPSSNSTKKIWLSPSEWLIYWETYFTQKQIEWLKYLHKNNCYFSIDLREYVFSKVNDEEILPF